MSRVVYVIGEPGAGKTTLVDRVLAGMHRVPQDQPVAHELLYAPACPRPRLVGAHLGRRRPAFGGTDALALNAQPAVLRWLADRPPRLVLGEGDRLANPRFFNAVKAQGHELEVVLLATHPQVAATRRAHRPTQQDPAWVAGRITKTRRLADRYATWHLGGVSAPAMLTRILGWPTPPAGVAA